MVNVISEQQNTPINQKRLAAQRVLYEQAKRLEKAQMILNLPVVITATFIVHLLNTFSNITHSQAWVASAIATIVAVIDLLILEPLSRKKRLLAAKIQEIFDTEVLKLPWNPAVVGQKPDREDVEQFAKAMQPSDVYSLHDWYPIKDKTVPLKAVRIICQRSNLRWDLHLREKYTNRMSILALSFFAFLLVCSLVFDLTLASFFLTVVLPFSPLFLDTVRQNRAHSRAIDRLKHLKQLIEVVWESRAEMSDHLLISRQIQDGLFLHRSDCPPIPEKFYRKYQDDQENAMIHTAEQMLEEL